MPEGVTASSLVGPTGCGGDVDGSYDRLVLAPANGIVASAANEGICMNVDGGGSLQILHLARAEGVVAGADLKVGDPLGRLRAAGDGQNGGYAHIHIQAFRNPACAGQAAFTEANGMRLVDAPDMKFEDGIRNQWAGCVLPDSARVCRNAPSTSDDSSTTPIAEVFVTLPSFPQSGPVAAVLTSATVDELEAAAGAVDAVGVWVQDTTGRFRQLVVGGPEFLRSAFKSAFPSGFTGLTSVFLTR